MISAAETLKNLALRQMEECDYVPEEDTLTITIHNKEGKPRFIIHDKQPVGITVFDKDPECKLGSIIVAGLKNTTGIAVEEEEPIGLIEKVAAVRPQIIEAIVELLKRQNII